MKAFHNDPAIKEKYLARVRAHQAAGHLVKGVAWVNGCGCAIGVSLEDYSHAKYETELGIPEWIARVEDAIFEGMSLEKSKTWPEKFLEAITPGADLEKIKSSFVIAAIEVCSESMPVIDNEKAKSPESKAAIDQSRAVAKEVIRCFRENTDAKEKDAASTAAYVAVRSSDSSYRATRLAYLAAYSCDPERSIASLVEFSAESEVNPSDRELDYDRIADKLLLLLAGAK